MGDFVTTRNMEDFLINPTIIKMQDQHDESRTSTLSSGDAVSIRRSLELLTASRSAKRKSSRSRAPLGDSISEQLYWRSYYSDEEAVSSVDSDTMSISSASSGEIVEAVPARLSLVHPEDLARSFKVVERQLHRAQAVVLKPIGRANSAASPKLVDIPPSPRLQRHSPISPFRPPISRLQRLDLVAADRRDCSTASTPRTSSEKSAVSTPTTPPTSIDERPQSPTPSSRKVLRKKPTMPHIRATISPERSTFSPVSSETQNLINFLNNNDPYPFADQIRDHIIMPIIPGRKKLRKFSSSFSISRFSSISKRKDSVDSSADEAISIGPALASRPVPDVYVPSRSSSYRFKMEARGASERAPVLVLPPCPNDREEQEQEQMKQLTSSARPLPKSYAPTGAPRTTGRLHKRERSASADNVMLVK